MGLLTSRTMSKSNQYPTMKQEQAAFFSEIGVGVTEWAKVENSIRYIVLACFPQGRKGITHKTIQLGFFSIENFRSKVDFADAIVRRKFGEKRIRDDWAKLVDRTRKASALRNKLVHRSVRVYADAFPGRRVLLVPWIFKKPKRKPKRPTPPEGSLGLVDLIKFRFEFFALHIALENFRSRLLGQKEQLPKDLEQALDPPTIQNLARLIRVELSDQLESSDQ